jgi:tellurite resistance protein TehA-like permease
VTFIILASLVSYLYFNQKFLKVIASAGFAIQFISTAILVYNISQTPHIKLDKFLPYMALLLEALRIVAIYCLISHKDIPKNTSTTE